MKSDNLNVVSLETLITPDELKKEIPITDAATSAVSRGRDAIGKIFRREDPRLFFVVGPCSIHDEEAALEYAKKLAKLSEKVQDSILLVMRVYFEKPRTTIGWKGYINDPYLDGSFKIEEGLKLARQLMIKISEMGLPIATEALDPISPQYLQDLVSWTAIGARTTESQTHREMASGLSSAVGFKNGTDGGLSVAINALQSVTTPHRFLGIDEHGKVSIVHTSGNVNADIVLRGGHFGPNYSAKHIQRCEEELANAGVSQNIVIDCSHANSNKQADRQPLVLDDIVQQIEKGNKSITGVMIESHLNGGKQPISNNPDDLAYGVSITDACLGWDETEKAILHAAERLEQRLPLRISHQTETIEV